MGGASKTFAMAITAVSGAIILAILFAWFGPGIAGVTAPASAQVLFDEQQVQQIYAGASPAVVEVIVEDRNGDSFVRSGFGSGFLIDNEGHIVTNNHVIAGADRVRVRFLQGNTVQASVLGRNPANDLALLKVDPEAVAGIAPLELGDSSLVRPGQLAIAIGSPFQLEGTITAGIISGVNRSLPSNLGRSISGVLQTDALIGPGNSGGPLLNSAGQVVGVNTAMEVPYYGAAFQRSVGFAVPSNSLARVLPQLKTQQLVQPPWLGVSVADVDALRAQGLDLPVEQGVYVTGVVAGSPAQEAGIIGSGMRPGPSGDWGTRDRRGDIIVAVADIPVRSAADLVAQLDHHQPGDEVSLTVVRDGAETEVPVTLAPWPEEAATEMFRPFPRQFPSPPREPDTPRRQFQFEFELPRFPFPGLIPEIPNR